MPAVPLPSALCHPRSDFVDARCIDAAPYGEQLPPYTQRSNGGAGAKPEEAQWLVIPTRSAGSAGARA